MVMVTMLMNKQVMKKLRELPNLRQGRSLEVRPRVLQRKENLKRVMMKTTTMMMMMMMMLMKIERTKQER